MTTTTTEHTRINTFIASVPFNAVSYTVSHNFTVRISTDSIFLGARKIVVVEFTSPRGGMVWRQAFYRSLGKNSPDVSPAGQWLPIKELGTKGYSTWLDKSYWDPTQGAWQGHNKDVRELPFPIQDVCQLLSMLDAE